MAGTKLFVITEFDCKCIVKIFRTNGKKCVIVTIVSGDKAIIKVDCSEGLYCTVKFFSKSE